MLVITALLDNGRSTSIPF